MTADDDALHALLLRAASGDEPAWDALCPLLERRLSQMRDVRNIVIEVIARLRANQFERLKLYLHARTQTPGLALETWLRVVAKRAGMGDVRGERTERTAEHSVRQLLANAAMRLPEPQLSAIELFVEGVPLETIAEELELDDVASTIVELTHWLSCEFVGDLVAERRRAEAARRRELSCARFELVIAACSAGTYLDEHLRHCAPCLGVAETIIELSLRE